jgi:flagellar basal body-associated protein FliL
MTNKIQDASKDKSSVETTQGQNELEKLISDKLNQRYNSRKRGATQLDSNAK